MGYPERNSEQLEIQPSLAKQQENKSMGRELFALLLGVLDPGFKSSSVSVLV